MAALKVDKPRIVERDPEGTLVSRHFEDGSTRMVIYKPDGEATIVTRRTNPSTGAEERVVERPDGSELRESFRQDGSSLVVTKQPDGSTERVEVFKDENGRNARTTTFADGSVETELEIIDSPTSMRSVLTRADGNIQVTTVHTGGTNAKGETVVSEIIEDNSGFISRRDTTAHADGSSTSELRDGPGASHVLETATTTTSADGAVRMHLTRADGTDETTLTREFKTADGATVTEIQSDNQVQTITVRDGSRSDVTKFEDGTSEANDFVTRPDGTVIVTRTNRDQTFESTEHLPAQPGEPQRSVTTRTDGTRTEQVLDDERMTTTTINTDGTKTVKRQDMDGVGSTATFDKDGNQTQITTHDGEPLEPFPTQGSDRSDIPVGGVAAPTEAADTEPDLVTQTAPPAAATATDAPETTDDVDPVMAAAVAAPPDASAPVAGAPNATPPDDPLMQVADSTNAGDPASASAPVAPVPDDPVAPTTVPAPALEPDPNAPIIEIDDKGNIQVDDFAENVNYAYTVTETEGGGEIGPDPDGPVPQPLDSPLESFPAEQINDVSLSVTEVEGGGEISPDPDVSGEAPLESF